jgi:6-phosphogluconolactonase
MSVIRYCLVLALASMPMLAFLSKGKELIVYVGTYTQKNSKGIYAYRFDAATGSLTPIGLVAETANPSFLAVHPNKRYLYAVGEGSTGSVSAFSLDRETGKLQALNTVSAKGNGPCHLSFDQTGKWLFVANYGSGSIAALPVQSDGKLGEASAFVQHSGSSVDAGRQKGPHAHSVDVSPDNRFLLVSDLGLDQALVYRFDAAKGTLIPNQPPSAKVTPGSGPRHLAFGRKGEFVYVLNEMTSTVTALRYDKRRGSMEEVQTLSALPVGFSGNSSGAEILVHPGGRFLYSSNRGHDSIAVFSIDPKTGLLKSVDWVPTQGKTPRNFAIDPSGNFLLAANQNSDNITVFRIDQTSGALTAIGNVRDIPSPVSLVFVPAR